MMMTFEEFAAFAENNIKKELPPAYRTGRIHRETVRKAGGSYHGMVLVQEDRMPAPTIDLDLFYAAYQEGMSEQEVLGKMAEVIRMPVPLPLLDLDWILDYEQIRDCLRLRLTHFEKCRDLLPKVPHRMIADLVLTYHVTIELPDRNVIGSMVTTGMLEAYGISEEQLHADALASSMAHQPSEMTWLYEDSMLILTNKARIQGASVIAYPGTLDQAAESFGGGFYLLPSSVHEVILLRDTGERNYRALETVVRQINRSQVEPQEQLCDYVYYYEAQTRRLIRADQRD